MRSLLASTSILALTIGAHAQVGPSAMPAGPLPVRPECAVPPQLTDTFSHVWYFDPVSGQPPNYTQAGAMIMAPITVPAGQVMKAYIATLTNGVWSSPLVTFTAGQVIPNGGNGSQAAPWNNLSALAWANNNQKQPYHYPLVTSVPTYQLNSNTHAYGFLTGGMPGGVQQSGPIQPGDEVLLMGGNYGNVAINLPKTAVANSAWITVTAAPGQTPVLTGLSIADTNLWQFLGLKVQGGNMVSIGDGGGGALTTHDIVFSHIDMSSADDAVSKTWTQTQWASLAGNSFSALGSHYGDNTYCVGLFASVTHSVHEGPSINAAHSIAAYNESRWFTDNGFGGAGSYKDFFFNFVHDPVDVGLGYHVDGWQLEGYPLLPGDTRQTYTQIHFNGNRLIDHYDPTAPFPTKAMTMMDDYSGQGTIWWDHLLIENNVYLSSGTCILMELQITNSIIRNNTCVPASWAQWPLPSIGIGLTGNSNVRIVNNIAPAIYYPSNQPGVTGDNNVTTRLFYNLRNPDGSYKATGTTFTAPGWYGPAGRGPYSATGSDGTPLTGNNNQVVSAASFRRLFQQAPTQTVPPSYDLSLVPGALLPEGRNLGAGRRFTVP